MGVIFACICAKAVDQYFECLCVLNFNNYGFHYSVNVCSLQLGVTLKVCVVIPDLFNSTLCPFCISLMKSALTALMGTERPALFKKLQVC